MKKILKRVVAILCTATMVAGIFGVGTNYVANASEDGVTKEWSIISEATPVSNNGQLTKSGLNFNLGANSERNDFVLYLNVTLGDDAAVTTMQGSTVEVAQEAADDAEITWGLKSEKLVTGENEIYLMFEAATDTIKENTFDTTKTVNHFRMYNVSEGKDWKNVTVNEVKIIDRTPVVMEYPNGATATVAPDDVPTGYVFAGWYSNATCTKVLSGTTTSAAYAKFVNKDVLQVKAQYATQDVLPGQVIANCDDMANISTLTHGTVSTDQVREGKSSYKKENTKQMILELTLTKGIDVQKYVENGYLHFWLHVDNPDNINNNLRVEFGQNSNSRYKWYVSSSTLEIGWNEIYLKFADCTDISSDVDMSAVSFIRIYEGDAATTAITTYVDDIRVVEDLPGQMIWDCDSKSVSGSASNMGSVTTILGEFKEGTGALKYTGKNNLRERAQLSIAVDITGYDTLHFWMYVSDASKISDRYLWISLGSQGSRSNTAEIIWKTDVGVLDTGWNEINVELANATVAGTLGTDVRLKEINNVQIWLSGSTLSENITTIVDDIRVINNMPGKFITNCDEYGKYITLNGKNITKATDSTETKEGNAFKSTGAGQIRFQVALKETVNIKEYESGTLQFWLYVGDKSTLTTDAKLTVEITSAGTSDQEELSWGINMSDLKANSWNKVTLSLATATPNGTIDLSAVDFFRFYMNNNTDKDIDFILDEICVVPAGTQKSDLRFVTTVDSVDYQNVGFIITLSKENDKQSNTVYKNLYAVGSNNESTTYVPYKAFAVQSNYFNTYTIKNIPDTAFTTTIKVKPYWTTQDGTRVYGAEKTYTISNMTNQ